MYFIIICYSRRKTIWLFNAVGLPVGIGKLPDLFSEGFRAIIGKNHPPFRSKYFKIKSVCLMAICCLITDPFMDLMDGSGLSDLESAKIV